MLLWSCKSNLFQLMNLQDYLFSNLHKNFKFHFYLGQLSREHFINVSKPHSTQGLPNEAQPDNKNICKKKCKHSSLREWDSRILMVLLLVLSMYLTAKFKYEIWLVVWFNLCNGDHANKALLILWNSLNQSLHEEMSSCLPLSWKRTPRVPWAPWGSQRNPAGIHRISGVANQTGSLSKGLLECRLRNSMIENSV